MPKKQSQPVISSVAYAHGEELVSLQALARRQLLSSSPKLLASFGFDRVRVTKQSAEVLALTAAKQALSRAGLEPSDIGAILYSEAIQMGTASQVSKNPLELFTYPASFLQYQLGAGSALVQGFNQAGCVSLVSAVRSAWHWLLAEPELRHILCVGSDVLPKGVKREMLYNAISDAACAVVVSATGQTNRLVASHQVTKGYFWTPKEKEQEMIAAYFPTAKHLIAETLRKARLTWQDIALIVPHNVNKNSWHILAGLLGVPTKKVYLDHMAEYGHTVAADVFVNLDLAVKEKRVRKGDYALLFTFGFGAHWACMIVQH